MTIVNPAEEHAEYDEETLKHLQNVLLNEVLKDFITICEENNIEYFCAGGTTLGAIRHEGFIPWDDDIDVTMFREEYEKFYEVMKNKTEKFEILTLDNEGFFRLIAKLNLKHTKNGEPWDINTNFTLGLGLDINILDNIPTNKLKRYIFIKKVLLLKRLNLLLLAMTNDRFFSKPAEKVGHVLKKIFKIIGINQNFVRKVHAKLISYPKGTEVGDLHSAYTFMPYPIEIFSPPAKAKFESLIVNVPKDWDTYLRITYGDNYMELPPKEEQINHGFDIDFGPY